MIKILSHSVDNLHFDIPRTKSTKEIMVKMELLGQIKFPKSGRKMLEKNVFSKNPKNPLFDHKVHEFLFSKIPEILPKSKSFSKSTKSEQKPKKYFFQFFSYRFGRVSKKCIKSDLTLKIKITAKCIDFAPRALKNNPFFETWVKLDRCSLQDATVTVFILK